MIKTTANSFTPGFETMSESRIPPSRLVEQVEVSAELIQKVCGQLQLTPVGEVQVPEEGRIASNVIIQTRERGGVMLRFYPPGCQDSKLESGCVDFEVEVLGYLSSKGLSVPTPLLFAPHDQPLLNEKGIKVFAYPLLPGKSLSPANLSISVAAECSRFLSKQIEAAECYRPSSASLPEGDLVFLNRIVDVQRGRFPQLENCRELDEMRKMVNDPHLHKLLQGTPKGIVHADFFFENILRDSESGRLSAIDFGDAYYGYVLMDVVIGSMEFCVQEDRSWDLKVFEAFLEPQKEWLQKRHISFDLFYDLLVVNCFRFALYTLPFTLEEEDKLENNPYLFRYRQLDSLKTDLREKYERVVTAP